MKIIAVLVLLCAGVLVLAAGCTSQQPAAQTTVPATTMTIATFAPTTPVATVTATGVPADLARRWTLTLMAARNGTELTTPTGDPVTLTFLPDGTLIGNGGCNDYSASFTLSGQPTPKGDAIAVGPITATKMFCNRVAAQEQTYFTILHRAVAYDVNINTLRITASDGTYLSFTTGTP